MGFYNKYIPEGQEIKEVIHQHWLTVMDSFILWLSFGALIPSFLYYQSERLRDIIPFYFMEIILFSVFLKIVYEIYNWYFDVWIVTDKAVYDLEWSLLKTNLESIHFENIEGVEIDKHRIWDSLFSKGDIIIHKFGEEALAIYNANKPYKAVSIIESYIHPEKDEETDRFDMIMDALSGVVSEHLKKHGTEANNQNLESEQEYQKNYDDEYSIDAR